MAHGTFFVLIEVDSADLDSKEVGVATVWSVFWYKPLGIERLLCDETATSKRLEMRSEIIFIKFAAQVSKADIIDRSEVAYLIIFIFQFELSVNYILPYVSKQHISRENGSNKTI